MANLNRVFLLGNLTRDPDLRYAPSGMAICQFGLAMNRRYQGRNGEEVNETCFVDIDVFAKQAESCKSYLQKGAPVLVEGHLKLDQWEDRNTHEKRSRLKVVAERVQFLAPPSRGGTFSDEAQPDAAPVDEGGPPAAGPRPAPSARPQAPRPAPSRPGPAPSAPARPPAPPRQAAPPPPAFDAGALDAAEPEPPDPGAADVHDELPF
ncbi:MAG: Single-stranded DNA-binding protein [Lentisphaerae bacterium ADurb.BinA184]|nr:MAG: Single-stranded DNA-binding protein [Lentisphaerae bacterium ADurb.BinA184]